MNYLLPIVTVLLALFTLAKDWESHKKSWRRWTVLMLITLFGIGWTINTYFTNRRTESLRQQDQVQIAGLKKAVETANKNQEDNTKQFVYEFGRLSEKLSNLQTQLKTEGLQKEAEQLQKELRATQEAMNPPKALLSFSFKPPSDLADTVRTVTLPVKDGIIHIEFNIINAGEVAALDGEIMLIIPEACKFASEPPRSNKLPGTGDAQRNFPFERILPHAFLKTLSADVRVPPNFESIGVMFEYRCRNCTIPEPGVNRGTIFLAR